MPSNLKKLIRARMLKTGESYQTARRYILAHGQGAHSAGASVAELLKALKTRSGFCVLVGRQPAVGVGADPRAVQAHVQDLINNPRWYAESGSVSMLISRGQHDILLGAGAADDTRIKMLRSNVADGFPKLTFSDYCENCHRLIWCGQSEHEAECVCGQHYRVSFDLVQGLQWTIRQGMGCADCGTHFGMTEVGKGHNPWRSLNAWQVQCQRCSTQPPAGNDRLAIGAM